MEDPNPALKRQIAEINRLIDVFDKKPLMGSCDTAACNRRPTTLVATSGSFRTTYRFCDRCATASKAPINLSKYLQVLQREWDRRRNRQNYRPVIEILADYKGLPPGSEEQQILKFFEG